MTLEELLNVLPQVNTEGAYQILNDKTYYLEEIKDSTVVFKQEDDYWNLAIQNDSNKTVIFIENEMYVMKDINSKKCDWVLLESNYIHFVESKDVKPRNRKKERKDAVKQLTATLDYYVSKLDLSTQSISVMICFKSASKIVKSGDQLRKLFFKETYDADFFEGNVIEY